MHNTKNKIKCVYFLFQFQIVCLKQHFQCELCALKESDTVVAALTKGKL